MIFRPPPAASLPHRTQTMQSAGLRHRRMSSAASLTSHGSARCAEEGIGRCVPHRAVCSPSPHCGCGVRPAPHLAVPLTTISLPSFSHSSLSAAAGPAGPSFRTAFALLLAARLVAARYNIVHDCDEVRERESEREREGSDGWRKGWRGMDSLRS